MQSGEYVTLCCISDAPGITKTWEREKREKDYAEQDAFERESTAISERILFL